MQPNQSNFELSLNEEIQGKLHFIFINYHLFALAAQSYDSMQLGPINYQNVFSCLESNLAIILDRKCHTCVAHVSRLF